MARSRLFGGKRYQRVDGYILKSVADRDAKRYRSEGYKVRVVPASTQQKKQGRANWALFTRK